MEDNIDFRDMIIEGFDPEILQLLTSANATSLNLGNVTDDMHTSPELNDNTISPSINTSTLVNLDLEPKFKKVQSKKAKPKVETVDTFDSVKESNFENVFLNSFESNVCSVFNDRQMVDIEEEILNSNFSIKFEDEIDINVVIVGCGGNGSRLLNLIAQQAYSNRRIKKIILFDDDRVEVKNLSRQLFYEFEVGEFKAQALADRYNMLYGLNIISVNEKFSSAKFYSYFDRSVSTCNCVIFDCVDNKDGRIAVEQVFKSYSNNISYVRSYNHRTIGMIKSLTVISCGNQKDHGQVHIGYKNDRFKFILNDDFYTNKSISTFYRYSSAINNIAPVSIASKNLSSFSSISNCYLSPFLEYNKTFEDSKESVSCADMEIAEEQSMAINATVVQVAFNMFFEMMANKDGLKHNIVFTNLSNDVSMQKVQTYEQVLDYYLKSTYGKNIFFEREKCLEDFCKASGLVKSLSKVHFNSNLDNDIILNEYKSFVDSNKTSWHNSLTTILEPIIEKYFDDILAKVNDYIIKYFSEDYSANYAQYDLFLNLFYIYINRYCSLLYNNTYNYNYSACHYTESIVSNKLRRVIAEIHNSFVSKYSDIASKSSFEYFVKG